MKIISSSMAGIGWIVAFAALGAAGIILGFGQHHLAPGAHLALPFAEIGAEFGVNLAVLALCFALLPGARRNPAMPQPFGLAQGIWGLAGFGIAMAAGGTLTINVLTLENLILVSRHSPVRIDFSSPGTLRATVLAGEITAALWVAWFVRRLGAAHTRDGSPTGIGWRAAPAKAYAAAFGMAMGIIGIVLALYHVLPPDTNKLQVLPMAQLFEGSVLSVLPLLIVAVFVAPALEEIVFRGIAFAGLAARLGPGWAGVITTLIFMAAHAQEKIHYLPGFLDVGLIAVAAVWLRLKFHSIRPGILLHIVYNSAMMLAVS